MMFQNRVHFITFCSLFDHGSLQVKCETTKRCSKTGSASILFDHGSLQVKCETTKRCFKTGSASILFDHFFDHGSLQVKCETTKRCSKNMIQMGQFGDFLANHHLPQACSTSISPSQKYGSERDRHQTKRHTCDEHRFLDPSYTIAPKGAIIVRALGNVQIQNWGISALHQMRTKN